jgi:hypothetical protein
MMTKPELPSLSPAAVEFLTWAADDFVEIFCLRDVIRRQIGVLGPEAEKEAGLTALRELIAGGLLRVGEMHSDAPGLIYWEAPPPALIERIKNLWSIQTPPAMGEPPWFYATDEGKRVVDGLAKA